MSDTINALNQDYLIQVNKNLNTNEIENYILYKNYFISPPVLDITNIEFKKIDIKELDNLLVYKYGLVRMKIQSKLKFLENYNLNIL